MKRHLLKKTIPLFTLITAIVAGQAQAAQIYFSDSVALQHTDITDVLTVSQFDESLGTLNSVELIFSGTVEGSLAYENQQGAQESDVDLKLRSTMTLTGLEVSGTNLFNENIMPVVEKNLQDVAAYDGINDYAGNSGGSFDNLSGSLSETTTYDNTNPFYLIVKNIVTGNGNVNFDFEALGSTTGSYH